MVVKNNFASGDALTAADVNTYLTNGGLVYITEVAIGTTGVAQVPISNVFSSSYDNYLITINSTGSQNHSLTLTLGASTVGSQYYGFLIYGDATTNTVLGAGRNNQNQMNWIGGCASANQPSVGQINIANPFAATYTRFFTGPYQDGTAYGFVNGEHRSATSYTGCVIWPNAGTLSGGKIRVYGYRQA